MKKELVAFSLWISHNRVLFWSSSIFALPRAGLFSFMMQKGALFLHGTSVYTSPYINLAMGNVLGLPSFKTSQLATLFLVCRLHLSWREGDNGASFINISYLPALLNSSCLHRLSKLSDLSRKFGPTHVGLCSYVFGLIVNFLEVTL